MITMSSYWAGAVLPIGLCLILSGCSGGSIEESANRSPSANEAPAQLEQAKAQDDEYQRKAAEAERKALGGAQVD
jgi:hypothetical protein